MDSRKTVFNFAEITSELRSAGCVFAEEEARLLAASAQTAVELSEMIKLRTTGIPLEYIIGWVEFCGVKIYVDRHVFVPRRRTEFLVQQAASAAKQGAVVIDLCCGSGAIGAALAAMLGKIHLHASDIEGEAVRCARRNIGFFGGHVYEGDLYDPFPQSLKGSVDLIVANALYVPTEKLQFLPSEARNYEAQAALDGGEDGLDLVRRIAVEASDWLAENGRLLVEASGRQAGQAREIFAHSGLAAEMVYSEEFETAVVIGTKAER